MSSDGKFDGQVKGSDTLMDTDTQVPPPTDAEVEGALTAFKEAVAILEKVDAMLVEARAMVRKHLPGEVGESEGH